MHFSDKSSCQLSRRHWLLASAALLERVGHTGHMRSTMAADVPWLKDVTTPPIQSPEDTVKLSPLLLNQDGKTIETLEAWETEREKIHRRWLDFLGPMPAERPTIELQILAEDHREGITRQLVRYETEEDVPVEGYLLKPSDSKTLQPRPGIVALHQTTRHTIDQVAGLAGPAEQQVGWKLARRGLVVFCPRCFLWQNATNFVQAMAHFKRRHPHTNCMHKMLWDASRGVDVLTSLPEVAPNRIGAAGHSLGAIETLYLAAFDERIKASAASEPGIGIHFNNWYDPWFLGPAVRDPDFPLDHHQLLAMIAPRPFLLLSGESGKHASDGDRSWPYLTAAAQVYQLYDQTARIGMHNHHQGHTLPSQAFEKMAQWLEAYL